MRFVIVGGGIAGVSALEHLCHLATASSPVPSDTSADDDGEADHVSITLITPAPVLKHITNVKRLSNNRTTFDIDSTPHAALLASLPQPHPAITIHLATLTRLDPPSHTVWLSAASAAAVPATIRYDRLLLAVGASPTVPFRGPAVHVLRDVESVDEVQAAIAALPPPGPADAASSPQHDGALMVVGNGGIALELVHALTSSQPRRRLVWVVKDAYMGNTFLDREASAFLLPLLFPTHDPAVDERKYGAVDGENARTGGARGAALRADKSERVYGGGVGPSWQTQLKASAAHKTATEASISAPANLIIHFNTVVTSATPSTCAATTPSSALSVSLSNGFTYTVALLLSATGVWPNTAFLASPTQPDSALQLDPSDGGVVTDASTLRSSVRNVWAAGDCTHLVWRSADDAEMLQKRTWAQARTAGLNAAASLWHNRQSSAGEEEDGVWYPLFTHTTRLFGRKVVLLGLYNEAEFAKRRATADGGGGEPSECSVCMKVTPVDEQGGGEYVKCVMERGRVVGCTLIGETQMEDMMENLIVNRTDMSAYGADWLHADIDLNDYFD